MALFDVLARRPGGEACPERVPHGFQAVAEMLLDGRLEPETLRDAGRAAADIGTALETLLDDLATTCGLAVGLAEPGFALVKDVAAGWAEAQTTYLHTISCEDPLTGLAPLPHVRTTVSDRYRAAERDGVEPLVALVVVDLVDGAQGPSSLDRTMRLVHLAGVLRTAFSGDETLGQLSNTRAVAVVRRDHQLATGVRGLQSLLSAWSAAGGPATRVWIEGLPASAGAAVLLLGELAR